MKEVAILSSLVTCLLLKVIGWLGGIRCFLPDIFATRHRGMSVSELEPFVKTHFCQGCSRA